MLDIWLVGFGVTFVALFVHHVHQRSRWTAGLGLALTVISAVWFILWPGVLATVWLDARIKRNMTAQLKDRNDLGPAPIYISPEERRRKFRIVR